MASIAVTDAQVAALRFVGLRANDVYGSRLGRVEAVLVDRERGTVQWLHVRMTGFSGAYLALPLRDLTAGAGHLHFPYERARLMSAPRVPESGALTSRVERQLCDYFLISAATRGAAVSAWERRATSARLITPGVWEPAPRGPGAAASTRPSASGPPGRPLGGGAPRPSPPPASGHPFHLPDRPTG